MLQRYTRHFWFMGLFLLALLALGACQAVTEVTSPVITVPPTQIQQANIFLIALEDDGQNGPAVGCGDSLVPIAVEINLGGDPPLTQALEALLAIDQPTQAGSDLYNALYQSDLTVTGVTIENGQATILLTGGLLMGGTCDVPRVEGQLLETALQFEEIDSASYFINDIPLEEWLDAQG
jgi:hypothetical protein